MNNDNTKEFLSCSPTLVEVNLTALEKNFRLAQRLAGKDRKVLAVVKADAYGHGMVEVARRLVKAKAEIFGVTDVREGIILRKAGIKKPILLFENILPDQAAQAVDYHLTVSICTLPLAVALDRAAKRSGKKANIHIKVDTGMGRLGVWYQEAIPFVRAVSRLKNVNLEGIYTHFPVADTLHVAFTKQQIKVFSGLVEALRREGISFRFVHAANSMGTIYFRENPFNLVRPGLMLYGMYPDLKIKNKVKLHPVLSVQSKVIFVKRIQPGRSISYGRTFIAKHPMTVVTIPLGYGEGYLRSLSHQADVLINGRRCPVLGRVTMDYIIADVTKAGMVQVGSPVVLLGCQKNKEISAEELAEKASTINYEITCSLGSRLLKIYY